jgi:hypothetical protein
MTVPHSADPTRPLGGTGTPGQPAEACEELLVADDRAGLTPSQLVERKLIYLLKAEPLPVSQVLARARLLPRR